MTRLNNGTYNMATAKDVAVFIDEANALIEKYGWQDRTVTPYSYPEKVTKIVNTLRDYNRCTTGSQHYLIALANGLADILEAWERHALEPKKTIRFKNNDNIIQVSFDVAQKLIEDGYAEAVCN